MKIQYTREALKDLAGLGGRGKRIVEKVQQYAKDPDSLARNVTSLKGRNQMRLRVADYRILFSIDDKTDTMLIEAIRPRSRAYD